MGRTTSFLHGGIVQLAADDLTINRWFSFLAHLDSRCDTTREIKTPASDEPADDPVVFSTLEKPPRSVHLVYWATPV